MMFFQITLLVISSLGMAEAGEGPAEGGKKPGAAGSTKTTAGAVKKAPGASSGASRAATFFAGHSHAAWWRSQVATEYHGFVGPTHHRIDVVFQTVQRDARQPARYYVRGKSRYKGVISPFSGSFTLQQLDEQTIARTRNQVREEKTIVTGATGRFTLQLSPNSRGTISGTVALDMLPEPYPMGTPQPTGFTFDGKWRRPNGASKDVIWSDNLFSLGNAVLGDFEIGGRGPEINPKYYAAGWDTYWENEEWWAQPVARRK